MSANPKPPKRTDRAIVRTDAQLAKAAAITAGTIVEMRLWWPGVAPRGFEGLVEAKVEPERKTT